MLSLADKSRGELRDTFSIIFLFRDMHGSGYEFKHLGYSHKKRQLQMVMRGATPAALKP